MEYLNFEVQIRGAGDDKYEIVVTSPAGEASAPMEFRRDELQMPLQRLVDARGAGESAAGEAGAVTSGIENSDTDTEVATDSQVTRWSATGSKEQAVNTEPATTTARAVGESLFKSLLPSERLRLSYHLSLDRAMQEEPAKGLRVRLRIETPELAALPWEFAFDELGEQHVALSVQTPITRYLDVFEPQKAMTVEPPLRILGMIASPKGLSALNTQRERERMESAIQHLTEKGTVELHWLEGQTARDLSKKLDEKQWHVLHYIGHGGFDQAAGQGFLSFANAEGREDRFTAEQLSILLGETSLNLVVLNSCEGARSSDSNLFSSTAATLIKRGMPAVVSMQYEITDHAAIEFSREFYDSLANGNPVDFAVQKSRKWIKASKGETVEWATPVLFLRAPDGRLFDIEKNALIATDRIQNAPGNRPVGIVQTNRDRDLGKLINRLRTELTRSDWNNQKRIEPEFEGIGDSPNQDDTDQTQIRQYLTNNGGVVLILGEAGAGMTTTLRAMYAEQLELAFNDASQPVPVLINLSSWNHEPFGEWLADQINDKHLMPTRNARGWIEDCSLQLYLDGLDEMRPDQRIAFPQVFNRFAKQASLAGIVVSCREKEYRELPKRLRFNEAFRLKPLSVERINLYVARFGPELDGLRNALKEDSSLAILAHSPVMLLLMVKVYRDQQKRDVADVSSRTAEATRRELMKAYVKMMFEQQRSPQNA